MEVNPYESPRPGEPTAERIPNGANSVLQLLTEIRDGQRDLLELHRETLAAQQQMLQRYGKFGSFRSVAFVLPIMLIGFMPLLLRWYVFPTPTRVSPPVPARVAPAPPTFPPGASLDRPVAR